MSAAKKRNVVIVTPALADANNGNWQTAHRWQRMLSSMYRTRVVREWPDGAAARDGVMIALHARRSASSIEAWHQQNGMRGLALVLTGTDLYGDINIDASAKHSLALAQLVVVLQERGPDTLPAALRAKARVIFQSTTLRRELSKTGKHLRAVMVGHLREEKSPQTLFAVARLLQQEPKILIDHIGAALDPKLGKLALSTAAACNNYRWLGSLPHDVARARIQRAHVLVHTSRIEGGAHVIMEAACSGTPVLASRVDGNVGMLGTGYAGYFEHGDEQALAELLMRYRDGVVGKGKAAGKFVSRLKAQCKTRQALFEPDTEKIALHRLVDELLSRRAPNAGLDK